MNKAVWGGAIRLAIVTLIGLAVASCGDMARQGTASSFLIVTQLEATGGSSAGGTLASDVVTVVNDSPTILDDKAEVTFALGMKDPGSVASPSAPSQANWITVDRYRVRYVRSDGRNREGLDVPYSFDGAFTATVPGQASSSFMIVRHQAKMEAPLAALAVNGLVISTIAQVTFYGHDQTGREVSATANMGISFANFGDAN